MPAVLKDFGAATVNTKLPAWKLGPNEWQALENVVVRNGTLTPLADFGTAVTTGLTPATTYKAIYKLNATWFGSTTRRWWNNWQDAYLIWADEAGGASQISNGTTTTALGPARPATAPSAATSGAGVISGSITYVVTYVDGLGQESGPSPVSGTVTATNNTIALTSIPTSGTLIRKLYRTVAGTYLRVATMNATDTTYSDNADNTTLSDPLLTSNGNPAPALSGLAIAPHIARVWGWTQNKLYYSNTGAPWSWSLSYISIPENIVAAAPSPQGLLVLTAARPYLILGSSDSTFALKNVNNTYGCSASFSLTQTDRGLVWWSPAGLVLYDGSSFELLTEPYMTPAQVAAISTTNMIGVFSQGYFHLFHSTGSLTFDMRQGQPTMQTTTQTIDGAFVDHDGTFYCSTGQAVKQWAQGSNLTMRVRTMMFGGPDQYNPDPIRRVAAFTAGTVTPQFYQSGNAWGLYSPVASSNGMALCWATMGLWQNGDVQLSSTSTINQIEINAEAA
jgi:hypothetical protein